MLDVYKKWSYRFKDPVVNGCAFIFSLAPIMMKIPPFSFVNKRLMTDLEAALGKFCKVFSFFGMENKVSKQANSSNWKKPLLRSVFFF